VSTPQAKQQCCVGGNIVRNVRQGVLLLTSVLLWRSCSR